MERYRYWLRQVFADGGYAGDKPVNALAAQGKWTVAIIKRSDKAKGFEASIASAKAWLELAGVKLRIRRLATS